VLRLDDTDRARSTEEFAAAIEADLRWLGLDWDRTLRQSERLDRYEVARARLAQVGRAYEEAGAWRLRIERKPVGWTDLVQGPKEFHGRHLQDPVLVRSDGTPLYLLASVVDDAELGVTHILRGEDHVSNTAVQIQLFEALGASVPAFGHLALIAGAAGDMLSKRTGSLSLAALREGGLEPMTVASLLATLGTSDPVEPRRTMRELVDGFDIAKFGRAPPKLDPEELKALNAKLVRLLPYDAVAGRVPGGPAFWDAVRPNVATLAEAAEWARIVEGPVPAAAAAARDFLAEAAATLPPEPWDEATWGAWTNALSGATGRKGKALFLPLRLALTGKEQGPELRLLLPLIGRERALARLAPGGAK
jgi:glutamyl-tRNA synthetase